MTADSQAVHTEAVPDTELGTLAVVDSLVVEDSLVAVGRLAVVVHTQAVEDSQNIPDSHRRSVVAGNSCKDCSHVAMAE